LFSTDVSFTNCPNFLGKNYPEGFQKLVFYSRQLAGKELYLHSTSVFDSIQI